MDCGGDGLPLGTHYYHTDRESSLLSLNHIGLLTLFLIPSKNYAT